MNGSPVDMTMNIDETGKVFYTRLREVGLFAYLLPLVIPSCYRRDLMRNTLSLIWRRRCPVALRVVLRVVTSRRAVSR